VIRSTVLWIERKNAIVIGDRLLKLLQIKVRIRAALEREDQLRVKSYRFGVFVNQFGIQFVTLGIAPAKPI
jgi:hypothetical protein